MSQRMLNYKGLAAFSAVALPLASAAADIQVLQTDQYVGGIVAGAAFQSLDGAVAFGGSGTGRFYQFSDWAKYTMWVSQAAGVMVSSTDNGKMMVARLASGDVISGGGLSTASRINIFATNDNRSQGYFYKYGNFNSTDLDSGYIGFSFLSAGGSTRFGWAELEEVKSRSFRVVRWAYEDSGAGIEAGQTLGVPAPGGHRTPGTRSGRGGPPKEAILLIRPGWSGSDVHALPLVQTCSLAGPRPRRKAISPPGGSAASPSS